MYLFALYLFICLNGLFKLFNFDLICFATVIIKYFCLEWKRISAFKHFVTEIIQVYLSFITVITVFYDHCILSKKKEENKRKRQQGLITEFIFIQGSSVTYFMY